MHSEVPLTTKGWSSVGGMMQSASHAACAAMGAGGSECGTVSIVTRACRADAGVEWRHCMLLVRMATGIVLIAHIFTLAPPLRESRLASVSNCRSCARPYAS